MANKTNRVDIYTDGACSGNPGPGGWGVLMIWNGIEKELSGGDIETTNNRMELIAVIEGVRAIKRKVPLRIHTDSKYVMDGMTRWIEGWKNNGWKTAGKKPVKNIDLWQALDEALDGHQVEWEWVKGHSGHEENDRADELARAQAKNWAG